MRMRSMVVGLLSALLIVMSARAGEQMNLKYECGINKSESLKVYMVEKEGASGAPEVSIALNHFMFGENEMVRLAHPNIIKYGDVMMISQNFGRSGYFFMRFEENRQIPEEYGDVLGMMDDSRFNPQHSLGYSAGHLSALANCKKVQ